MGLEEATESPPSALPPTRPNRLLLRTPFTSFSEDAGVLAKDKPLALRDRSPTPVGVSAPRRNMSAYSSSSSVISAPLPSASRKPLPRATSPPPPNLLSYAGQRAAPGTSAAAAAATLERSRLRCARSLVFNSEGGEAPTSATGAGKSGGGCKKPGALTLLCEGDTEAADEMPMLAGEAVAWCPPAKRAREPLRCIPSACGSSSQPCDRSAVSRVSDGESTRGIAADHVGRLECNGGRVSTCVGRPLTLPWRGVPALPFAVGGVPAPAPVFDILLGAHGEVR